MHGEHVGTLTETREHSPVVKNTNMDEKKARMIAEEIESIVYQDLSY